MKYKQNDYELLYLVEEENEDAKEFLYEKYQSILKGLAKSMYESCKQWNGVEYQDFYQEACYGFEKAIATFDERKNILFYTYATSCIRNQLSFYRRSLTRKKDTPLNCSISIYQEVERGLEYADLLKSTQQTPYEVCERMEKEKEMRKLQNNLSFQDACIFELRYNGFQYKEIAQLLEIPAYRVSHALQKIKQRRSYFCS